VIYTRDYLLGIARGEVSCNPLPGGFCGHAPPTSSGVLCESPAFEPSKPEIFHARPSPVVREIVPLWRSPLKIQEVAK